MVAHIPAVWSAKLTIAQRKHLRAIMMLATIVAPEHRTLRGAELTLRMALHVGLHAIARELEKRARKLYRAPRTR